MVLDQGQMLTFKGKKFVLILKMIKRIRWLNHLRDFQRNNHLIIYHLLMILTMTIMKIVRGYFRQHKSIKILMLDKLKMILRGKFSASLKYIKINYGAQKHLGLISQSRSSLSEYFKELLGNVIICISENYLFNDFSKLFSKENSCS